MGHVYSPILQDVLEKGRSQLETEGVDLRAALEEHIRDLCAVTRRNRELTVALVGAVQEYTIRVGGPPDPEDQNDPRTLAPIPDVAFEMIRALQTAGRLREYPPALDIAVQVTNLLLLRCMTRPSEAASESAELLLTILFGVLSPETLVESGRDGRPFKSGPGEVSNNDAK